MTSSGSRPGWDGMLTRLRTLIVAPFFLLIAIYAGTNPYRIWERMRHDRGWELNDRDDQSFITAVSLDGPAAGVL